jgi:hypothetical protein
MDNVFWLQYFVVILFSLVLVVVSLKEFTEILPRKVNVSNVFRRIVGYLGLFVLVFTTYNLLIELLIFR